jgi:hypothetical protein
MKRLVILFAVLSLLLLPACPFQAGAATRADDGDMVELTVKQGDCLFNISKTYLDSSNRWPEIARINHLANPHLVQPGTTLSVPAAYLKRTPLPASVTFVLGDAGIQPGGQGEWVPLRVGDAVPQGSRLKTGDDSALEITFADGSAVTLKSGTELGILKAERTVTSHILRDFYLGIGRVISRIKEATGASSRYRIRTPSAIASVRGTEFRLAVDEAQKTLAEVVERQVTVAAAKKSVDLERGEGTAVEKGRPPLAPRKLLPPPAPADLKTVYNTAPAVTFGRIEGAGAYRVAVTQDKEGRQLLTEKVIKPGEPFRITGLADGFYFLAAQSVDELGLEGLASEAHPFRIRVNPMPPITQAPKDGVKTKGKSQDFQWLSVSDAVLYHVQIARDREFRTIVADRLDVRDTTVRTEALEYGPYYFRVSSIADDGYQGAWSDPLAFTLNPLPPTPAMDEPSVSRDDISLRSRSVGEGYTYRFQIARESQFQKILEDRKTERPEITIARPEEAGVYYVRIAAIDQDGDAGDYSPPQSFEIKERFPFEILGGSLGLIVLFVLLH